MKTTLERVRINKKETKGDNCHGDSRAKHRLQELEGKHFHRVKRRCAWLKTTWINDANQTQTPMRTLDVSIDYKRR